jgi:NADH:ubiquinone oxidoreductase subunit B-like Fe-S oxidoreductase
MFRDSYNWDRMPGEYVHIDAFIPGCPPKPEAIISAIVKLVDALRSGVLVPGCLQESSRVGELVPEAAGAAELN